MWNLVLLTILGSVQILVIIPLIIGHLLKIQAYQITDQADISELISKLKIKRATILRDSKPYGFVYGKWYFGYITKSEGEKEHSQSMCLVMRSVAYDTIKKEISTEVDKEGKVVEQKFITICDRSGNPWWWNYKERKYNTTKYLPQIPRDYQQSVIDDIINIANKKPSKSGTFFIHGEPGVGKSLMLMLLAKQINGYYCDSWNPTDPGDFLNKAYRSINPTEKNPLIMVLEECDAILNDMLENRIERHKEIPVPVRKKADWNRMLDKTTDLGFFPHLILILTSNISKEMIDQKDLSLLRKGRIDQSYHITKDMIVDHKKKE